MWKVKKDKTPMTKAGPVARWEKRDGGLFVECVNVHVFISHVSPEIIRIRAAAGGRFDRDVSYAVVDSEWPNVVASVSESASEITYSTGVLKIAIDKATGSIKATDGEGRSLIGGDLGARGGKPGCRFDAPAGEMYFGLGQKTGGLDKRGKRWGMKTTDRPYLPWHDPLYQTIPFLLAFRGGLATGLFFDNTYTSFFDLCEGDADSWSWGAEGGETNIYIIAGPNLKDVVSRYYKLVGGIPMPPKWALGYHQSRYSYMNDEEVRKIAKNLRDLEIPCDAIHLDIHYMRGYRDFTFDTKRFPDVKKLTDDLKRDGMRLMTIVDPGVKEDENWDVWRDGVKKRVFCEYENGGVVIKYCWPLRAGWPDFGKPEAREWWGEQHKFYLDNGIAGFWNDMNEPSMWNGAFYFLDTVVPTGIYDGKGMVQTHFGEKSDHERCRNVYGHMENKASREGLLKLRPNERPFVFTRSGYAGVGRYAAMWTGDNFSTWIHLRDSIPMLLNLGLSGEPICGPDIGGFVLSSRPQLYARWIQLGALYPFCRTHTAIHSKRQEPYSFGKQVEAIARKFITLRYKLMPFIYSLVHEANATGAPVWRPMAYEFPNDSVASRLQDQFMMGSSLLIAPVVRKNSVGRSVYLPAGEWTEFSTGETRKGAGWIDVSAPLDFMPMYIRQGGIIPMGPPMQYTDQVKTDPLTVVVAPGDGSFDLYEDDGSSMGYERGEYSVTRIESKQTADGVDVSFDRIAKGYDIPKRTVELKFRSDAAPKKVAINGAVASAEAVRHEGGYVSIIFTDEGAGTRITLAM